MHQLHKRLTGAANSSIEIIIAWSELLQMRKRLFVRNWIRRLLRYLCIPVGFFLVVVPLYSLMIRQTIQAQSSSAMEMLAIGTTQFERCLSNIRSTTNKLFSETEYTLLASSYDNSILGDYQTLTRASKSLQDKTYDSSVITYSYITFERNGIILDDRSAYESHSNFYPGALEYEDVSQEEWDAQNQIDVTTIKPAHVVKLMHSSYGNSYITVYQPYVNTAGRLCGAMTVLIKEKDVVSMFLSQQQWRKEGLFCLISDDGTILAGNNYDGTTLSLASDDTGWETYQGKRYLMATRYVASLNATAVIGMPPSLYESGLLAVQRAICLYLIVGVLGCVLISVCMTLEDMNSLRPMLDTLDESDLASRKVLNEIFLRNVNSQHELARELEHSRSELEHGKMEILLRTGSVSQETLQQLTDAVQLKAYNFLLLIPSLQENAECSLKEELRTVVVSEQIRQIYGQRFYVQATADDLILVILTQETDEAEELREMCFRTEQLYDALHLTTPLILSDPFEKMEQLSDIYWKARNVAAYADPTQKICYLGNSSAQRGTTVNATNAARLREYLLSGCTEEAVSLLSELFSVDNLDPENFKQDFYTAGGILLNTAERVCCPDIAYLCSYDSKLTARQMLSRLQDCCVEICNHVQFLKHSHNDALQKNILDWLAQNFQNPEINAAMTAEQFKISKKYLSQFLKEQTGKSYTEYVEELRLDHAMQLLRTTDLNITDIVRSSAASPRRIHSIKHSGGSISSRLLQFARETTDLSAEKKRTMSSDLDGHRSFLFTGGFRNGCLWSRCREHPMQKSAQAAHHGV